MRIGFLNNQIDGRGTGNAVYNYAHYNEEILGNKSKIFTLPSGNHNQEAVELYVKRFGSIHIPDSINLSDVDALYHIKSGENDGFKPANGIPYLVHAVFHPEFHGDRFAVISEWMSSKHGFPYVPHIVELPDVKSNLRAFMGIPEDAKVFGRIGGYDSFDISWAWGAIDYVLKNTENTYFLFVNTAPEIQHPTRVRYFPATLNVNAKRAFINSCDAMLHARSRGETFGISVGEFSLAGKHIITYGQSYEKAHYFELRGTALRYDTQQDLIDILMNYATVPNHYGKAHAFYTRFGPERVMYNFKRVFLDADTRD